MQYLLHGGKTSAPVARNQIFFEKVAKMPSPILFVYFARYEHEWEKQFEVDTARIKSVNPNIECLLANKDNASFIKQLRQAQTIFIGGGSTSTLKAKLEETISLPDLICNKFIVGTSAGACVLSTYYVNDQQAICAGMSILPMKVFCHYDSNKKAILYELKNTGRQEVVLLLPEADFTEIAL